MEGSPAIVSSGRGGSDVGGSGVDGRDVLELPTSISAVQTEVVPVLLPGRKGCTIREPSTNPTPTEAWTLCVYGRDLTGPNICTITLLSAVSNIPRLIPNIETTAIMAEKEVVQGVTRTKTPVIVSAKARNTIFCEVRLQYSLKTKAVSTDVIMKPILLPVQMKFMVSMETPTPRAR